MKQTLQILRALQIEFSQHWANMALRQQWQEHGVEIAPSALLRMTIDAELEIGPGTVIGPYSILDLLGDPNNPGGPASRLLIGKNVEINEFNNIRASGGTIRIGDECLISQFVSIVGSNHAISRQGEIRKQSWETTKRGVTIGQDVWIGASAVVLPGVTIGNGCVIAAGAVVVSDIPEFGIAAGVPARIIGQRE